MANTANDAYGFTFVDEDEFKAYEEQLKNQAAEQAIIADKYHYKLNKILALIDPFLANLGADPDKTFIKWKNRGAKVKVLQDQIATILKE